MALHYLEGNPLHRHSVSAGGSGCPDHRLAGAPQAGEHRGRGSGGAGRAGHALQPRAECVPAAGHGAVHHSCSAGCCGAAVLCAGQSLGWPPRRGAAAVAHPAQQPPGPRGALRCLPAPWCPAPAGGVSALGALLLLGKMLGNALLEAWGWAEREEGRLLGPGCCNPVHRCGGDGMGCNGIGWSRQLPSKALILT